MELSSSSMLLSTLYIGTAAFIPGSIVMFTTLPRWNGVSKLKPSARKGGITK
jgi:hypothetical protein